MTRRTKNVLPVRMSNRGPIKFDLGKKLWERMAPTFAVFIASIALIVSFWQGLETRRFNRLTSKPKLTFIWNLWGGNANYGLYLKNNGNGPAIISSIEIIGDDKRIGGNVLNALTVFLIETYDISRAKCINIGWISEGDYIGKGDSPMILGISTDLLGPPQHADARKIIGELFRNRILEIRLNYRSVYDEDDSLWLSKSYLNLDTSAIMRGLKQSVAQPDSLNPGLVEIKQSAPDFEEAGLQIDSLSQGNERGENDQRYSQSIISSAEVLLSPLGRPRTGALRLGTERRVPPRQRR